jgi:hypothetical protein
MKYMLGALPLRDTERFFNTFDAQTDPTLFPRMWEHAGQEFEPQHRVDATGASSCRLALPGGVEVVVLTLPAPAARNEAYFVAAVRLADKGCRVFALENAFDLMKQVPYTVLAEFFPTGRANWGNGSAPVVDDFVQLIQALINDAAARPNAFTPLPIMEM